MNMIIQYGRLSIFCTSRNVRIKICSFRNSFQLLKVMSPSWRRRLWVSSKTTFKYKLIQSNSSKTQICLCSFRNMTQLYDYTSAPDHWFIIEFNRITTMHPRKSKTQIFAPTYLSHSVM